MAVIQISEEAIEAVSKMESVKNNNNNNYGGGCSSEIEVQMNQETKVVDAKTTSRKPRNKNPGVRKVGNRVYDPDTGKTCHQCRQKTMDFTAECKNSKDKKPCPIKYCHKCLLNRYGEKAEEVGKFPDWDCPKCRGICNCSFCMKKQGKEPTGILAHTAKANGYNSVSDFLQANSSTNLNNEKPAIDVGSSPKKKAASETDSPASSSRKRGKEITVNGKVEPNLQSLCSPPSPDEQNPKKVKVKTNLDLAANIVIPQVMLPVGAELTTVCGLEMPPEDVSKALQFLEFCAAFGEIFEVKNGHPESILKDLIDGRSSRPGRFSLAVRFHKRLISIIQENSVEGSPSSPDLSPTHGKDSWVHALKECIYGPGESSKLQFLEHLDKGADGYEKLNSSEKLTILNMLCDEALNTEEMRNSINLLISEHTEKSKKEKERVHAAQDKEKHLKQKMQDEVAKAIKKTGAPLTILEHDALVSQIKIEAAQAHDEMLESIIIKNRNKTCYALRPEILHLDKNGHVYWRLKCLSSSSEMLVQGTDDPATSEEKWYSLDKEQKEVVEKHVKNLRTRRTRKRAPKVTSLPPCKNNEASSSPQPCKNSEVSSSGEA